MLCLFGDDFARCPLLDLGTEAACPLENTTPPALEFDLGTVVDLKHSRSPIGFFEIKIFNAFPT